MKSHRHYCEYRRHMWDCEIPNRLYCTLQDGAICDECRRQALAVASMIVPIICERCGAQKRAEDGRSLYVAWTWRKGKRMVCPACFEAEQIMAGMEQVVGWDDPDDVPF